MRSVVEQNVTLFLINVKCKDKNINIDKWLQT